MADHLREENRVLREQLGQKAALEFKRQAFAMLADGAGLSKMTTWAKFQAFVGPHRNEKWFST